MTQELKVFTCTGFTGRWPVGTCAIMVAPDMQEARDRLSVKLEAYGFKLKSDDVLTEVNLSEPSAEILLDGDY